jgi:hypothetical protein
MTLAARTVVLGLVALLATGCGASMRNMLEREDPPEVQAAARQDLTMPPDLRLPQPGSAPAAAPAAEPPSPAYEDNASAAASVPAATPPVSNDPYDRAGISRTKPDGTKKTDAELQKELQDYYIAQKRQKNPNYGTVFNMGNIFSDE